MTTGDDTYAAIVTSVTARYPSFKMVKKSDSGLMKAIGAFLKVITFGKADQFMTSFTTTIGYTTYTPNGWDDRHPLSRAATLRHEAIHMVQAKAYGVVWFSFLYLFAYLPCFLAYWRMRFEKAAYTETLRAYRDYGIPLDAPQKEHICGYFTGPSYAYMWPFPKSISKWYDATLEQVLSEQVH